MDATNLPYGIYPSTPPNQAERRNEPETIDMNGITCGRWELELHQYDIRSPYFWLVFWCPAIPLAQLQVRLGLKESYSRALLGTLIPCIFMWITGFTFLCNLVFLNVGPLAVTSFFAFICSWGFTTVRVAYLRTVIRERFNIAGSIKEDQFLALSCTAQAIYQMAVHIRINKTYIRRAPVPLVSYEV